MLTRLRCLAFCGIFPLLFAGNLSAGPAGTGAGLFPFLVLGSALPDLSLRMLPGEVPFGAVFSIEPTIGFRKRWKVYHRVTAQYHFKAENTSRIAYQPFFRPWYSIALGCGAGYFYQGADKPSGLSVLPAFEYIFEGDSEMTMTFGAAIDVQKPAAEVNLIFGFHYRGFWERSY